MKKKKKKTVKQSNNKNYEEMMSLLHAGSFIKLIGLLTSVTMISCYPEDNDEFE